MRQQIGSLIYLYTEELVSEVVFEANDSKVVNATKSLEMAGKNWIPVVAVQVGANQYRVVSGAEWVEAAKLVSVQQLWVIIADESAEEAIKVLEPVVEQVKTETTEEVSKVLEPVVEQVKTEVAQTTPMTRKQLQEILKFNRDVKGVKLLVKLNVKTVLLQAEYNRIMG